MPIADLSQLASESGVSNRTIASLIFERKGRYRQHLIAKRDGSPRTISVPLPKLLQIQKVINKKILSEIPIHECAVGFRSGFSILNHVTPHLNENKFAKFDIKDCFSSIKYDSVFDIYINHCRDKSMANSLTELSTDNGSLPQGAATSPSLCNIALRFIDERIHNFCKNLGLNYTRYADDLLISGPNLDLHIYKTLRSYIEDSGFLTNNKSRLMLEPQRLIVCGISIAGKKLKLPKAKKRDIRQATHFLIRNSLIKEAVKDDFFDPFYADRVLGRLTFWQFVEPTAEFPMRYIPLVKSQLAAAMEP